MISTATHEALADVMTGRVVVPGDADWDGARTGFNLAHGLSPAAVAFPVDDQDVVAVVRHAREHGLRVAPQATGHNAGAFGSLEDVILLSVSQMTDVSIDADARRVRVGAGTKWEKVGPRLSELGLAGLHGSSPDVGIAGYSLGGGMGWLARKYGLQANSVTAIELVTADGHLRRVDHANEPDLFWALRGGNGNFGVVTAIEFQVYAEPEIYAGVMFFPYERAGQVLRAWTEMLPSMPDEMMTWASLLQFPDAPFVPEDLRGDAFTVVYAAYLGDEQAGRRLLEPVSALGPVMDTRAVVAPEALADMAMDPPDPLPYEMGGDLIDELPAGTVDDLVAATGPAGNPLAMLQLRHMGGAMARKEPGAGARATLPGTVSVLALGVFEDAEGSAAVRASIEAVRAAVRQHRAGDYPNFVEEESDASSFFDEVTWARLRAVKAQYDPAEMFQGNHYIPPAKA
jgi:FAD/FMN-containing dehydrogenase